jgi:hypothetical protein
MAHHKFTYLCNMLVLLCLLFTFVTGNPVIVSQTNNLKQTAGSSALSPQAAAKRQSDSTSYSTHRTRKTHSGTYVTSQYKSHTETYTRAHNRTHSEEHSRSYKTHEATHSGHHTPYASRASKTSTGSGGSVTDVLTLPTSQESAFNRRYEFPTQSTHGNAADRWDHSYSSYRHPTINAPSGYLSLPTPSSNSYRDLQGMKERDVSLMQELSTIEETSQLTYSFIQPTHSWSSHGHSSQAHHLAYSTHARHSNHSDHSTHAHPYSHSYHSTSTHSGY